MDDGEPAAVKAGLRRDGQGQAVVQQRRSQARNQSGKGSVAGGSPGEHGQQKGREQGRIDQGEEKSERAENAQALMAQAGGGTGHGDREQDAAHGGPSAHGEKMRVSLGVRAGVRAGGLADSLTRVLVDTQARALAGVLVGVRANVLAGVLADVRARGLGCRFAEERLVEVVGCLLYTSRCV